MAMIYDLGILCFMHSTFLKFCVKRDNILKTETYNNATKHLFFFFLIKYQIPQLDKQCHFKHVVEDEKTKKQKYFLYMYI